MYKMWRDKQNEVTKIVIDPWQDTLGHAAQHKQNPRCAVTLPRPGISPGLCGLIPLGILSSFASSGGSVFRTSNSV